jgi:transposase
MTALVCGALPGGLHTGQFAWVQRQGALEPALQLSRQQFDALVLGLPWQRLEELSVISRT